MDFHNDLCEILLPYPSFKGLLDENLWWDFVAAYFLGNDRADTAADLGRHRQADSVINARMRLLKV